MDEPKMDAEWIPFKRKIGTLDFIECRIIEISYEYFFNHVIKFH